MLVGFCRPCALARAPHRLRGTGGDRVGRRAREASEQVDDGVNKKTAAFFKATDTVAGLAKALRVTKNKAK